jgi:hypothetical protein
VSDRDRKERKSETDRVAASSRTSTGADAEPAARSAKAVRGASPYVEIKNEPAPKLIVDQPLPEGLAFGVVWIQYRVENLRIVPVFGEGAAKVSPRVGLELVNANHQIFPGQTKTVTFTLPVALRHE